MANARGPLPAWLAPLAWPLARAFGVGVAMRNAHFDRGQGILRLRETPVISVGNMSAGGTGKSPFVAWCAMALAARGAQPVIALRGYRATRVGASGGEVGTRAADGFLSDEAMEYASTAPEARVVVGARRHQALLAVLGSPSAARWRDRAVVVLDDGFQHRQLARDLDIVLVDATRPALDGDLLPNGWLREPALHIARSDLVVLTKAGDANAREHAAALVKRFLGRGPDAICEHVWRSIEVVGEPAPRDVAWLAGKRVLSACALGNPSHFHGMVARATGVAPVTIERRDHAAFSLDELEAAARRAAVDAIVLSRKDIVKLDAQRLATCSTQIVVPNLGIRFLEGEDRVRAAIGRACDAARAGFSGRDVPSSS